MLALTILSDGSFDKDYDASRKELEARGDA